MATILILALTVTLFSAIFFFLQAFPKAPPQVSSTFRATAGLSGTTITTLSLLYLSGPTLLGSTHIFAQSKAQPADIKPGGGQSYFTIATGLGGQTAWQTGQTWSISLATYVTTPLTLPDNITVTVVSAGLVVLQTSVPGGSPLLPPVFTAYGTSPSSPLVGTKFSITVEVQDANTVRWVNVTLNAMPGYNPTTFPMTANGTGTWSFTVPAGRTSSAVAGATYFAVVTATDSFFLSSQVTVSVVFH